MFGNFSTNVNKVCVHTGNILSLNEVKKKAGQNPTDELIESLKITLSTWVPTHSNEETVEIYRNEDDLHKKLDSEDRKGLKISVKVFISTLEIAALSDALNNVLSALKTECIDQLVLAYAPHRVGLIRDTDVVLRDLQELWLVLEQFVDNQKLLSVGVSDVDTEVFVALYNWAKVKPSIVQINLATCCVVPPALQTFTKEKEVQLLTHSDPIEILPKHSLGDIFGLCLEHPIDVYWALRFQVHVKCRGVLSSKGYTLCVKRSAELVGVIPVV